ncbi:hypothetical protein Vretifemale_20977, partial [Volvox reticuliferus]
EEDDGPDGGDEDSGVVLDTSGPDHVAYGEGGRTHCNGLEDVVGVEAEEERGNATREALLMHHGAVFDAEGGPQTPLARVGGGQQPQVSTPGQGRPSLTRDPVKHILTKPRVLLLQAAPRTCTASW